MFNFARDVFKHIFLSSARSSLSYNAPLKIVQEENHGEIDDMLIFKFVLG